MPIANPGQQAAYDQGVTEAQPAPPPAASAGDDAMAKHQRLGDMESRGLLTDDEFAAAKAKLLAG